MQKLIALLGIIVAIVSIGLGFIFPSEIAWMPDGFQVPIIAYEFLQTNAEVLQFFGPPSEQRTAWIAGMYWGHQWDYLYLLIYSTFLGLWGLYAVRQTKNKWFYLVTGFAALAAFGDIFENIQLVNILEKLNSGEFTSELSQLFIFTWLKWGSLALGLAGLSFYTKQLGWLGKIHVILGLLALGLGTYAFFNRSIVTSWFSTGISLQFVILIILALKMYWSNRKKRN